MQEKKKQATKQTTGGNGSIFDGAPLLPQDKNVNVSSGPYVEDLPIAGMSVGEVRKKFSDRFDIDPKSAGIINGNQVGDDIILKAGESLMFIKHAGEKGARVIADGSHASVDVTNQKMSIVDLLNRAGSVQVNTPVLPHGVRLVMSQGNQTLMFWERPPHIARLSWIAEDSPEPFGEGTEYRFVRIALPYLIIAASFSRNGSGVALNTGANECFFRNEPLRSLDDELLYPALLNCSVMKQSGAPLSWICTQYLRHRHQQKDPYANGLESVRYCLLETSFNLSSEHHEGNSWFGASKKQISQVETVEKWEQSTMNDPNFATKVKWLPTGHSIKQFAERTFSRLGAATGAVATSDDLARIIINGQ